MNIFNGIGNISKLDFYEMNDGRPYAKFTIAINRQKEGADFIPVTAFGPVVTTMKDYCFVGQKIGVTGPLSSGKYEKDGAMVFTLDVIADKIDILEWKNDGR